MASHTLSILQVIMKRSLSISKLKENDLFTYLKKRLITNPSLLESLIQMEKTGGEPAIVNLGLGYKEITIVDTSPESPLGRRSVCYDKEAYDKRKANKPTGTAVGMASEIGARLLTKEEYLALQKITPIDQKSSSWLLTPSRIRDKGGAIYGESRFGEVFIGANGAESYFSSRGFRLILIIE